MTKPLITEVTSANFDAEVMKADTLVLIDFYADWCGPCKQLAPTLEKVAGEQAGKVKVVKINVDTSPELADLFKVRSIPTIVTMKDGQGLVGAVGNLPKSAIERVIAQALQKAAETNIQAKDSHHKTGGKGPRR